MKKDKNKKIKKNALIRESMWVKYFMEAGATFDLAVSMAKTQITNIVADKINVV